MGDWYLPLLLGKISSLVNHLVTKALLTPAIPRRRGAAKAAAARVLVVCPHRVSTYCTLHCLFHHCFYFSCVKNGGFHTLTRLRAISTHRVSRAKGLAFIPAGRAAAKLVVGHAHGGHALAVLAATKAGGGRRRIIAEVGRRIAAVPVTAGAGVAVVVAHARGAVVFTTHAGVPTAIHTVIAAAKRLVAGEVVVSEGVHGDE